MSQTYRCRRNAAGQHAKWQWHLAHFWSGRPSPVYAISPHSEYFFSVEMVEHTHWIGHDNNIPTMQFLTRNHATVRQIWSLAECAREFKNTCKYYVVTGRITSAYRIRDGNWTEMGRMSPQQPQMFYDVTNPGMDIKTGDILAGRCMMNSMSKTENTMIG